MKVKLDADVNKATAQFYCGNSFRQFQSGGFPPDEAQSPCPSSALV